MRTRAGQCSLAFNANRCIPVRSSAEFCAFIAMITISRKNSLTIFVLLCIPAPKNSKRRTRFCVKVVSGRESISRKSKLPSMNLRKSMRKGFGNGSRIPRMTPTTKYRSPEGRSFRKKLNQKNLIVRSVMGRGRL